MPHSGLSPIVSVRIFILFLYFCMKVVPHLSQKIVSLSHLYFHSIFVIIRNREPPLFSLITQPWRHLGAILWFHVIIHIFITIHYKLIKINTHELQVIGQHINISLSACASQRARCAFVKILKCSKSPINNFEYEPGHLQHFKIFRPYGSARALCARATRMKCRNSKF